jgi:hypothetical protein
MQFVKVFVPAACKIHMNFFCETGEHCKKTNNEFTSLKVEMSTLIEKASAVLKDLGMMLSDKVMRIY